MLVAARITDSVGAVFPIVVEWPALTDDSWVSCTVEASGVGTIITDDWRAPRTEDEQTGFWIESTGVSGLAYVLLTPVSANGITEPVEIRVDFQ
jgi:hypothetical protein